MHEMSLMRDLIRRIEEVAREQRAGRVTALRVRLGALSHFTEGHFREHFEIASKGTCAEGARLDLALMTDVTDPDAAGVLLESVEVEV